jgi:hypothetical protein
LHLVFAGKKCGHAELGVKFVWPHPTIYLAADKFYQTPDL